MVFGILALSIAEILSPVATGAILKYGPKSGPEKGVITKGVFSLEESLESLESLSSLESLENARSSLVFQSLAVL